MNPVRSADANMMLKLPGGVRSNDLPVQRCMAGPNPESLSMAFVTVWMPDADELKRLNAGEAVELVVWGDGHPPVAVAVTDGAQLIAAAPRDASTLQDPTPIAAPPFADCTAPDRVCPAPARCTAHGRCVAQDLVSGDLG